MVVPLAEIVILVTVSPLLLVTLLNLSPNVDMLLRDGVVLGEVWAMVVDANKLTEAVGVIWVGVNS